MKAAMRTLTLTLKYPSAKDKKHKAACWCFLANPRASKACTIFYSFQLQIGGHLMGIIVIVAALVAVDFL